MEGLKKFGRLMRAVQVDERFETDLVL
jgi:hypothetical protein